MRTTVQIKPEDNVAIAVREIPKGTEIQPGLTALQDIPQAHKIALTDIPKDAAIIRYGVTLGYALDFIPKGSWINEHMLRLPTPPSLDDMPFGTNIRTDLPEPPVKTWKGYRNPEGGYDWELTADYYFTTPFTLDGLTEIRFNGRVITVA